MARLITELTAAGAVDSANDLLWLEQSGLPRKVTPDELLAGVTHVINTDINTATPPTTEAVTGAYEIYDLAGDDLLASMGFVAANDLFIQNKMHGGSIELRMENSAGGLQRAFVANPDGQAFVYYSGTAKLGIHSTGPIAFADITTATPPTTEAVNIALRMYDADFTDLLGSFAFEGNNNLRIRNWMHGGKVEITAEDASGTARYIFDGDPDSYSRMWAGGVEVFRCSGAGAARITGDITTATPPTTEAITAMLEFTDSDNTDYVGRIGYTGSQHLRIKNLMHGGNVEITSENAAGTDNYLFIGDPDGAATMYYAGVPAFYTHADGVSVRDTTNDNPYVSLHKFSGSARTGYWQTTSAQMVLASEVHGANVILQGEDLAGTVRNIITADPDAATYLTGDTDIHLRVAAGETAFYAAANSYASMYYDNVQHFRTKTYSGADDISAAEVKNYEGNYRDVGFAIMETVTKSAASVYTISETDQHKKLRVTDVTGGVTFPNDTGMKVDSAGWIINTTTSNLTLTATSDNLEVYFGDGVASATGNFTLAGKGWCTWAKLSDSKYELVGVGLS